MARRQQQIVRPGSGRLLVSQELVEGLDDCDRQRRRRVVSEGRRRATGQGPTGELRSFGTLSG